MKKSLIIIGAVIFAAIMYLTFATDYFDKTVIVLQDGRLLAADSTWESGSELMYENDAEIHIVEQNVVVRVEKRRFIHIFLDLKNWIAAAARTITSPIAHWINGRTGEDASLLSHPILVFALIAFLATLLTLRLVRTRDRVKSTVSETPPPPETKLLWPPSRLEVVKFFLNLYRRQLGAPPDARVELAQLAPENHSSSEIYELRVRHQGEWVSRRMTIGPLGEESGSKSKCYYVIYDVHLVVKLPAQRLEDFDEYIASMEKEGKIVDKLAPKECIIPKVSVILSLIHSLPFMDDLSAEQIEDKYVKWLQEKPEYIEYLKMNEGFVYFMDLSKYYFLGHIFNGLHDLKEAVPAEIKDNPEIIWEPVKFKGRYGEENETVCFEIRAVYHKCESEIYALVNKKAPGTRVTPFNIQTWFLTHLSGHTILPKDCRLAPELLEQVNDCFVSTLAENQSAVDSYSTTIRTYVGRLRAEQDKQVMGSISTNLLELLAWLGRKKIAMRDLKPDNLLVAGNPQKYPHFLRTASEYSLGIIDVETAVDYQESDQQPVNQPLLGGTPFYATPSHFIRNPALAQTYGDLGKILHLQDWYATMVMIYKVITGELLFDHTAKLFVAIKNKIIASNRRTGNEMTAIESISRQFWRSAGLEFQTKVRVQEATLKTVQISIPPNAAGLLIRFLQMDIQSLNRSILLLIESQPVLATEANRELVLSADHGRICQIASELAEKAKAKASSEKAHALILKAFNKIASQKQLLARKKQLTARLKMDSPRMSSYELLIVLFNTVLKAMYKEEWQSFKPEPEEAVCETEDEISLATTI